VIFYTLGSTFSQLVIPTTTVLFIESTAKKMGDEILRRGLMNLNSLMEAMVVLTDLQVIFFFKLEEK